jgi:hypothetical protein
LTTLDLRDVFLRPENDNSPEPLKAIFSTLPHLTSLTRLDLSPHYTIPNEASSIDTKTFTSLTRVISSFPPSLHTLAIKINHDDSYTLVEIIPASDLDRFIAELTLNGSLTDMDFGPVTSNPAFEASLRQIKERNAHNQYHTLLRLQDRVTLLIKFSKITRNALAKIPSGCRGETYVASAILMDKTTHSLSLNGNKITYIAPTMLVGRKVDVYRTSNRVAIKHNGLTIHSSMQPSQISKRQRTS